MQTETKIIEICPWCKCEVEVVVPPEKLQDAAMDYFSITCPHCKIEF